MTEMATATVSTSAVVPKSRPIRMPQMTAPAMPTSGRTPRRPRKLLKVRIFSEQYFATKSATAIFANSEGCSVMTRPGSRILIQRFAPLISGKQKAAMRSSRKTPPIRKRLHDASLR